MPMPLEDWKLLRKAQGSVGRVCELIDAALTRAIMTGVDGGTVTIHTDELEVVNVARTEALELYRSIGWTVELSDGTFTFTLPR